MNNGNGVKLQRLIYAILFITGPLLGWFGAQMLSPGMRISRLEAQVTVIDTMHLAAIHVLAKALDEHLAWANTTRDKLLENIEALSRLMCLEHLSASERKLMVASKIRCVELLGNSIPGQ